MSLLNLHSRDPEPEPEDEIILPETPPGLDAIRAWLKKPRPWLHGLWLWIAWILSGPPTAWRWLKKHGPRIAKTLRRIAAEGTLVRRILERIGHLLRETAVKFDAAAQAFRDPRGEARRESGELDQFGETVRRLGERVTLGARIVTIIVSVLKRLADLFPESSSATVPDPDPAPPPDPKPPPPPDPDPAPPPDPEPAPPPNPEPAPPPDPDPAPPPDPEPRPEPRPPSLPSDEAEKKPPPDPPASDSPDTDSPEPDSETHSPTPDSSDTDPPEPDPPMPDSPTPAPPAGRPPETPAPETPAPEIPAPEIPAPDTPAPEIPAPENRPPAPAALPRPIDWEKRLEGLPDILHKWVRDLRKRPRRASLRALILNICHRREWTTGEELARYLDMHRRSLVHRHLSDLVEAGLLELKYPDFPRHPDQAYRTRLEAAAPYM